MRHGDDFYDTDARRAEPWDDEHVFWGTAAAHARRARERRHEDQEGTKSPALTWFPGGVPAVIACQSPESDWIADQKEQARDADM